MSDTHRGFDRDPQARLSRGHPDPIIALAARYKLPAVYGLRYSTAGGGLISYEPDLRRPVSTCGRESERPSGVGAE
jgi:hypothetical protein